MIYVFHINTDDNKMDGFHQEIAVDRFVSMQGDEQASYPQDSKPTDMTKQNTSCGSLTSMLVRL
jgi:hypothetical protein